MANTKVQLLREERDLILKYGYPFERLSKALRRWPSRDAIKRISMSDYELEMLIGELSRSINHSEAGKEEDALIDLCDRLEYVEREAATAISTSSGSSAALHCQPTQRKMQFTVRCLPKHVDAPWEFVLSNEVIQFRL
jgi:hypothetical protein